MPSSRRTPNAPITTPIMPPVLRTGACAVPGVLPEEEDEEDEEPVEAALDVVVRLGPSVVLVELDSGPAVVVEGTDPIRVVVGDGPLPIS